MAKETATAVDNSATTGTIVPGTHFEKFKSAMLRRAASEQGGSFNVAEQMVERIITAETEADIWDADEGDLLAGRDLDGIEQEIRGYRVLKSSREDYETGLGFYVIVDAVRLSDGSELVWNTGSPGIIAKLRAFEAIGALPIRCFIRSIPTSEGKAVLKLRPVAKRAL